MTPDIRKRLGVAAWEGAESTEAPPGELGVAKPDMVAQVVVLLLAVGAFLHGPNKCCGYALVSIADPAFYLNTDPDLGSNADPDPSHT